MAVVRLDNIKAETFRWAFVRAGYNEAEAVAAFPMLESWLSGEQLPTLRQLEKFAAKFFVPMGFLFLQQKPVETVPFPMFRGSAGIDNNFDLNVYDTVMNIQSRQDWLEEYLQDNVMDTCQIVGTITPATPFAEAVRKLRTALGLECEWAFSLANVETAVNVLTEHLEEIGIFVAFNGVVGNNTHRVLKVEECRGFALVNDTAPYIFVNSADSKSAQMFTLIHETAHIMLGISAGHAGESIAMQNHVEKYCDMVAAEFLVPEIVLRELWNGEIKWMSRRFKVSELVIARRGHDLNLLSDEDYNQFWHEYSNRPINKKASGSGGSFYLTSVKRVGRAFAIHVRNAVNSRALSYTDAFRLTGLHGGTFEHFMNNNI